jgi:signal peptide peptidase SppA
MPSTLNRDAHLLSFMLDTPLAITEGGLSVVVDIMSRHLAGQTVDDVTLQAALTKRDRLPQPTSGGGVAVLPIQGTITPRMTMLSEMSGGTSFESLGKALAGYMADPEIQTIVLDIHSPGGSVAGATEFAHQVMAARATKAIIASINFEGASAAYWIASAATKIHAAKSASVGSVGILMAHTEMSKAMEALGVTRTYVTAGKYKAELRDNAPLSDEARAYVQARVDEAYDMFVADVSKGRGVSKSTVRDTYGEGRMFSAPMALERGMIDAIATLEETISHARSGKPVRASTSADSVQEPAQAQAPANTQDRRPSGRDEQQRQELALLQLSVH